MDKLISEPLILPERVRNGDFVLNLSRGGRLRGERLREAPRGIGSSNVVPPMLSPPKAVRKPKTGSDPVKPSRNARVYIAHHRIASQGGISSQRSSNGVGRYQGQSIGPRRTCGKPDSIAYAARRGVAESQAVRSIGPEIRGRPRPRMPMLEKHNANRRT